MRSRSRALSIVRVLAFCSMVLLAGCSLLPQDADQSTRTGRFEARDLDGFFDEDAAPSAITLDLSFSTIGGKARVNEVEGFWSDGQASDDACFDSYAASFLIGGKHADDDEFVYIAVSDSADPSSYVSIDGRVFADTASAVEFFTIVSDAADTCSDAGGYDLFANEAQVWGASDVSVNVADDLELPNDIRAIYQQEIVDDKFADGYRVYMLQRDNLIVAITVQAGLEGDFDFDDGDELVEVIAEALSGLR